MSWQHNSNRELRYITNDGRQYYVDHSVKQFHVIDHKTIIVLGNDGHLWWTYAGENGHWNSHPTPPRNKIDHSVDSFNWVDGELYVKGTDGVIWKERGPYNIENCGSKNRTRLF